MRLFAKINIEWNYSACVSTLLKQARIPFVCLFLQSKRCSKCTASTLFLYLSINNLMYVDLFVRFATPTSRSSCFQQFRPKAKYEKFSISLRNIDASQLLLHGARSKTSTHRLDGSTRTKREIKNRRIIATFSVG